MSDDDAVIDFVELIVEISDDDSLTLSAEFWLILSRGGSGLVTRRLTESNIGYVKS